MTSVCHSKVSWNDLTIHAISEFYIREKDKVENRQDRGVTGTPDPRHHGPSLNRLVPQTWSQSGLQLQTYTIITSSSHVPYACVLNFSSHIVQLNFFLLKISNFMLLLLELNSYKFAYCTISYYMKGYKLGREDGKSGGCGYGSIECSVSMSSKSCSVCGSPNPEGGCGLPVVGFTSTSRPIGKARA